MSDIFISYKREEQPVARKLADALQKKGWSVWWDPKLRAGEHFDDAIERALNDAKCIIVMWSNLSVNSRYVKDEATFALNRNKLVPIAIEEVDLPFRFEGIHAGQLIDWDGSDSFPGYQKLVADIENILGAPPVELEKRKQKEATERKSEKELKRKDAEVGGKHKESKAKIADERSPITNPKSPRQKRLALGIVALAVILALSVAGWFLFSKPQYAKTFENSIGMMFVLIPAGSFTMGSPPEEPGRGDNEKQHEVKISKPFYLQTTEVTQGQWEKVMGNNPSGFKDCGADCPVENVSWNDTQIFIQKLNGEEGGDKYRLPTEAEWEYASRAKTTTAFFTGECISTDQANYHGDYPLENCPNGEYRGKTVKVGSFQPNAWGLYDMHGNVLECVADDWHDNYEGAPTDGTAWIDEPRGASRVIRGGGWNDNARRCRSAIRDGHSPDRSNFLLGFRLARSVALGP